jgi:AraC-like DNA-binding protein
VAFVARLPILALRPFVRALWFVDDEAAMSAARRVLPGGGTVELIVDLLDDELVLHDTAPVRVCSGAHVAGVRTRHYAVPARGRTAAVGVHFEPGGAFPFLGISPAEIVNGHVELGDLWGAPARELRARLVEARAPEARFGLLERWLLRRLPRRRPSHPALRLALQAFEIEDQRIAEVADHVGLGRRRLRDVFTCEVGVSPKLYARLRRFHRVKEQVARLGAPPVWADVATACGYFDQSHLIREFVAFAGITPVDYVRSSTTTTRLDHQVHALPIRPIPT